MLDYFLKTREYPSIKATHHLLKSVIAATMIATPVLSAWAWHDRNNEAPVDRLDTPTTQRLPVEIITSDTQPKWVLVPIDPG